MDDTLNTALAFRTEGRVIGCQPYGSGHIHKTYVLRTMTGKKENRYILQQLNTHVFSKPDAIMRNIRKISDYLEQNLPSGDRLIPRIIVDEQGMDLHVEQDGSCWRCFEFIEGTISHDEVEDPETAYEAAACFGRFGRALKDLPPGELETTIPFFHDLTRRFGAFSEALGTAGAGRLNRAGPEIEAIQRYGFFIDAWEQIHARLPVRICHLDTKINNVLLDQETGQGVCVIDLDTVMPGTLLSDFGDMVRTFTNPAGEEEADLSRVFCHTGIYESLTRGFLSETLPMINQEEKEHLLSGARFIILMQVLRFLTDFLENDTYYRTDYGEHNLVRTRNQLKLLTSIESQEKELKELTGRIISELAPDV